MINAIILPQLYCPFPSRINPHTKMAERSAREWVSRMNLVPAFMSKSTYASIRVGELSGRTFFDASAANLELITAWNGWLHFWDDQCDEGDIGRLPERLSVRAERLREILAGDEPRAEDSAIVTALYDLRRRMYAMASKDWIVRFRARTNAYFDACIWEARNRAAMSIPDVTHYVARRRDSGAVYTEFELFEIICGVILPTRVRESPLMRHLGRTANNVVSWSNDIISFDKELMRDDFHNLPAVLQHEHGITLQEAVYRAAGFVESEVRRFIEIEDQLPEYPPELARDVAAYLNFLRDWMRGNIDWSLISGRFNPGETVVVSTRGEDLVR